MGESGEAGNDAERVGDAEGGSGEQETQRGDEMAERNRERRPTVHVHVTGDGGHGRTIGRAPSSTSWRTCSVPRWLRPEPGF